MRRWGASKPPTLKARRASLALRLNGCRPEMLPTLTAEQLCRETGLKVDECKAMLDEARRARG